MKPFPMPTHPYRVPTKARQRKSRRVPGLMDATHTTQQNDDPPSQPNRHRTARRIGCPGCARTVKVRMIGADHLGVKLMSLRYAGTCSACGAELPARTKAWWDATAKQVTCSACLPITSAQSPLVPADRPSAPAIATDKASITFAPPAAIDRGTGGISAKHEYERRHAKHERQREPKWGTGRIGRIAKFMSDEPQSTAAGPKARAVRSNWRDD